MSDEQPYNPLDKKNLGISVADALLERDVQNLPPDRFLGPGVYALYYVGDFPAYRIIGEHNRDGKFGMPIYVGRAEPKGSRKGLETTRGPVLHNRLARHARTIEETENLRLEDFFCRYLVVDEIWVPLGESLLIQRFAPLWNQLIDGFGNHDPGKGRYNQQRSKWDVLHPGRPWAVRLQDNAMSREDILQAVEEFLQGREQS